MRLALMVCLVVGRRGVRGELHRTVCRRRQHDDEHRRHVERDNRVDQQRDVPARDGPHAIRGGRDRNVGLDVGELGGQISGTVRGTSSMVNSNSQERPRTGPSAPERRTWPDLSPGRR